MIINTAPFCIFVLKFDWRKINVLAIDKLNAIYFSYKINVQNKRHNDDFQRNRKSVLKMYKSEFSYSALNARICIFEQASISVGRK